MSFVVDIKEDRGGVGANFIVEWQAAEKVISPIVQGIIIGGTVTHPKPLPAVSSDVCAVEAMRE